MKKISNIVGHRLPEFCVGPDYTRPHPHTSVGIEIEVEGVQPEHYLDSKRWKLDFNEGSLQNGVEYISEPVWGTAITDALVEFDGLMEGKDVYQSYRTSIHIHVNYLDVIASVLKRSIKLYIMYEPALFRLHEEWSRYENIYCVPVRRSVVIQQGYAKLLRDIRREDVGREYVPSKYAALNVNNLRGLGTLEYRHMGGTTDTDKISDWINLLLQLKVAALLEENYDDPEAVWGDQRGQLTIKDQDIDIGRKLIQKLKLWS